MTFNETIESEGSSPLRTFPALIIEEIMLRQGRGGNILNLIMNDIVQEMSAHVIKMEDIYE